MQADRTRLSDAGMPDRMGSKQQSGGRGEADVSLGQRQDFPAGPEAGLVLPGVTGCTLIGVTMSVKWMGAPLPENANVNIPITRTFSAHQ